MYALSDPFPHDANAQIVWADAASTDGCCQACLTTHDVLCALLDLFPDPEPDGATADRGGRHSNNGQPQSDESHRQRAEAHEANRKKAEMFEPHRKSTELFRKVTEAHESHRKRTEAYSEQLPSFHEVPAGAKEGLMIKKLRLCSFVFDFSESVRLLLLDMLRFRVEH